MPKRNKPNRNWNGDGGNRDHGKFYFEHDDRAADPPRRVSFKPTNRPSKRRTKSWEFLRTAVNDGDVDMSGAGASGSRAYDRFNPYTGRGGRSYSFGNVRGKRSGRNSPLPNAVGNRRRTIPPDSPWYKVILPHGGKYSKDYILKTLGDFIAPLILIPVGYKINGNESTFHIEDFVVANELLQADRKITANDGFKINIIVRTGSPHFGLTESIKQLLQQVMARRYNPATKALDLSTLRDEPELIQHPVQWNRRAIFEAVLKLVAENIPELAAINLSDNRLHGVDVLRVIVRCLPSLTVLHISQNKISNVTELEALKGLRLVELVLEDNPISRRYEDKSAYVSDVRKIFPKVMKLDGMDLPPPILFDVQEEETKLPPAKAHFACSEEGRPLVQAFLEQYYGVYDSESRVPLADAYHEDAYFSLTSAYTPSQNISSNSRIHIYISNNRNLIRVKDTDRRRKLLNHGRQNIVSVLTQLPQTEHDPQSFTFDLLIFTPQLMVVAVSGLFREKTAKQQTVRSFSRVMVIVPHGVGMCITNDELVITNATPEQIKVAFQPQKPVATQIASPPGPSHLITSTPASTVVVSPIAATNDAVRQQIVEALAQQTGMNVLWAKKCLDDTNWDPQTALNAFTELSSKGLVPAEAFVK